MACAKYGMYWNVNYKQNLLFCLWCSVLIHVVPRDKSQLNFFGDGIEALSFIHVGMLLRTKVVSQLCLTELAQTSTVCFFPKQKFSCGGSSMEKKVCTQLVCACTLAFSRLPSFGFGSATVPCMHCLLLQVCQKRAGRVSFFRFPTCLGSMLV